MSNEDQEYLAVLKATYDYEPQSEDEIAMKENQIVFLIERVDDDWSKVKIKGESQEEDSPIGLVPAAWVEQADHSSVVKAIYDYTASASGELSVSEDEILLAFDTEEDWLLVQSTKDGGKAGYVPANYVEPHSEEEEQPSTSEIVVPPSPPRPTSSYVDPADRVAATKVSDADEIKTWSVSEVDQKGKKIKGTLGIGKGAVFFASETSKAAVQRWPSSDILRFSVEKNKHLHIQVGGANPSNLHFNVGSRDNVDAITAKLEHSKSLAAPPASLEAAEQPEPSAESHRGRKPSVHFAPESPIIIPDRHEVDEEAVETDEEDASGELAVAIYDFTAAQSDELTVKEGEQLLVIEKDDEWWKCRNSQGDEGAVPASYLEPSDGQTAGSHAEEEEEEEEEDIHDTRAQDAAAQAAREAEARSVAQAQAAEAKKLKEAKDKEERARREKEERLRREKEEKARREKEERARKEAEQKAKATADQDRAARHAQKEEKARAKAERSSGDKEGRTNSEGSGRVRVWHDRTGQFRTDAEFLGFSDGKVRLKKTNGVIVEVPSEKMAAEDMRYVEKIMSRKRSSSKPQPSHNLSDDDIPLALKHPNGKPASSSSRSQATSTKQAPLIDWFDFFLAAGCDMHDCTRYAASFERDKIDESILADITESTMRSLGLREGDIIRVRKAIAARFPQEKKNENNDQSLLDDTNLQDDPAAKNAPQIFSGPGGVLKPRRGRPTGNKSVPTAVDLNAIGTIDSPQLPSPATRPASTPIHAPARSNSAMATSSGFDDDAWTNRTKPATPQPPTARPPSAPAAPETVARPVAPQPQPAVPVAVLASSQPASTPNLAKTTESDIFNQLSRLSELRKNTASVPTSPPVPAVPATMVSAHQSVTMSPPPPSIGFQSGLGAGNSPSPIGQFMQHSPQPAPSPQSFNGPRGPFAPVPSNQGLLQPLIPTQTGFNSFIPTRPTGGPSPFQNPPTASPFQNPTTVSPFQNPSPQSSFLSTQPTGFPAMQPVFAQPTGLPFGGLSQPNGMVPAPTGFNPNFGQTFNSVSGVTPVPPVPPLPSQPSTATNPAQIFAQMKSGTFATDHDNSASPPGSDKYDALRPNPVLLPQATGWGTFGYR